MTNRLLLLVTVTAALVATARAAADLPPGFIGVSPQTPLTAADFELMQEAGVSSVRLPMFWTAIQPESPSVAKPSWSAFDRNVGMAAEQGISVFPFLWGTPSWAAKYPTRSRSKTPGSGGGGPRSCAPP